MRGLTRSCSDATGTDGKGGKEREERTGAEISQDYQYGMGVRINKGTEAPFPSSKSQDHAIQPVSQTQSLSLEDTWLLLNKLDGSCYWIPRSTF